VPASRRGLWVRRCRMAEMGGDHCAGSFRVHHDHWLDLLATAVTFCSASWATHPFFRLSLGDRWSSAGNASGSTGYGMRLGCSGDIAMPVEMASRTLIALLALSGVVYMRNAPKPRPMAISDARATPRAMTNKGRARGPIRNRNRRWLPIKGPRSPRWAGGAGGLFPWGQTPPAEEAD